MEIVYHDFNAEASIDEAIKQYCSKVMKALDLSEDDYVYNIYAPCGHEDEIILTISFVYTNISLPEFEINGKSHKVLNDICVDYVNGNNLSITFLKDIFKVVDNEILLK